MLMSLLIILLCIERSLTIGSLNENVRIDKENDEPKDDNKFTNQNMEQTELQEGEYEYEDLGDNPDVDMNISSGTEGQKYDIKDNKNSNKSLTILPKLNKFVRLIRAALPNDNTSKIEEAESDLEEEEEFEDSENSGSTEEQYEAESYDNVQPTNRAKIIAVSDRSKRLTINTKKGTASSSPDMIEMGEDESLNENDGEDYDDFLPTRKVSMTMRTRQRRTTSKGLAHRDVTSLSSKHSKNGKTKDNVSVGSDSNENKHTKKKNVVHGRKGKTPKSREKQKNGKSQEECDFEDLKKAYNEMVCSVENFINLANKSVQNKWDDICKTSTSICQILPTVATYCKNETTKPTFDWCISSTKKLECGTTCDDSDIDSGERLRKSEEDDDISPNLKKKHKSLKMENPIPDDTAEKNGVYLYNDYDSVDPNEYDTNVPPAKSTSSSPSLISRLMESSTFRFTESEKNETHIDNLKNMSSMVSETITRDVSMSSSVSYSTNDVTKEPKITWTTFHYEPKLKLKPSRRPARRMSTEFQKILSRRKYHFTRHREQKDGPKDTISQPEVTKYPILKNLPPGHDGDTEIIEVEYV